MVKPTMACTALSVHDLVAIGGPGSRITAAVETVSKAGHAVCAVEGVLAPAIRFAVQLPMQNWTQRYLQVGCGGLCGSIASNVGAADGCLPLNAGSFVLAATDMGHQDQDGSFGADEQKRVDFAYRAQHLTALAAKGLIQSFYGQKEKFAYFNGCSDGGREALVEAQRYPDDFDGILAGAAALNFQVQNAVFHAWQARANTGPDGRPILLAPRLPILHDAVLKACDTLDGLKDGLIANPLACRFDPATVRCPTGTSSTQACLSAAEVEVARKFYDGPRDPASGLRLTAGGPQPGSELAWAGVYVPYSAGQPIFSEMVSLPVLRHLAFDTDPPTGFKLADLRFDTALFDRLRPRHRLFDATNPDLDAFAAQGGKLIIWHGWADPHISPLNSIAYHEAVRRQMGAMRTDAFSRLYVLPGVYHCGNGEGPHQIDLLTPLMAWVERGVAPEAIATRQPVQAVLTDFGAPRGAGGPPQGRRPNAEPPGGGRPGNGPAPGPGAQAAALGPVAVSGEKIERSRPVYPWPSMAAWNGSGDPGLASSFKRGTPVSFEMPQWAGMDFFAPYIPALR